MYHRHPNGLLGIYNTVYLKLKMYPVIFSNHWVHL
nr:MAG TPA: hypothetical protein [Caudoviricetes sp.]